MITELEKAAEMFAKAGNDRERYLIKMGFQAGAEWQLSQQVSDPIEFLKWMQENDCYNGTNGIGFWIMYDIEYSSEELYSLYKQSKPLTP